MVHNFTWHISSARSNKMLCFQGNQKGTFPRGLKQGEHAVAVVDNTTDKGCYSCNAVSAPKRHKERKKKQKPGVPLLKPFTCETTSQQVKVPQEKQPGTRFQPVLISLCSTLTPSRLPPKNSTSLPKPPAGSRKARAWCQAVLCIT